jgi:hypothetical protein
MEARSSSETLVAFIRLHDIKSQKLELYIVTIVRTSNPTYVGVTVEANAANCVLFDLPALHLPQNGDGVHFSGVSPMRHTPLTLSGRWW